MDPHCPDLVNSIFDNNKILPKNEFRPFIRKKDCTNPDILHFNHPSCCNESDYVAWRKDFMAPLYQFKKMVLEFESTYMEPLLKYDQEHPIPEFERINNCSNSGDHIDAWWCCAHVELSEYIDWFEKTQSPFGFRHGDFGCFPSKEWPYMHFSKRYEKPEDQAEMTCDETDCKHCNIL